MSLLSWIYMLTVWALITFVNIYCFYRVFTKKGPGPDE